MVVSDSQIRVSRCVKSRASREGHTSNGGEVYIHVSWPAHKKVRMHHGSTERLGKPLLQHDLPDIVKEQSVLSTAFQCPWIAQRDLWCLCADLVAC